MPGVKKPKAKTLDLETKREPSRRDRSGVMVSVVELQNGKSRNKTNDLRSSMSLPLVSSSNCTEILSMDVKIAVFLNPPYWDVYTFHGGMTECSSSSLSVFTFSTSNI